MRNLCPICGRVATHPDHRCPPVWRCGIPELHGEHPGGFIEIRAHQPQEAAAMLADRLDADGDACICEGIAATVVVVSAAGDRYRFAVTGEVVRDYRVWPL
ncbi:MAG: hypothetical protein ACOY5C_02910 [Pseudomonadota bacterium]